MCFTTFDSSVEKGLHDAVSMLPPDIQDAALAAMDLSGNKIDSEKLPRRMLAIIMLVGGDGGDTLLRSDLIKPAIGFEMLWAADGLRRNTWCGVNGAVRAPVAVSLTADRTRILGNILQSLARSQITSSSGQPEYLLHVAGQLAQGSLSLSEASYFHETLNSPPSAESVHGILEKRAEFFGCAALANWTLFGAKQNDPKDESVRRFGISFGLAHQLWMQIKFVTEVRQGAYWDVDELLTRDYLRTYPIAFALQIEEEKGKVIPEINHLSEFLVNLDPVEGVEHTRDVLLSHLQTAAESLDATAIPSNLLNRWRTLVKQLILIAHTV